MHESGYSTGKYSLPRGMPRPEGVPRNWVDYHFTDKWIPPEKAEEFDVFVSQTKGKLTSEVIAEAIRVKEGRVELHFSALDLGRCTGIIRLPENLDVGVLYLDDCTSLTALPNNLLVREYLRAVRCTQLREFSDTIQVKGIFEISGTPLEKDLEALRRIVKLQSESKIRSVLISYGTLENFAEIDSLFRGSAGEDAAARCRELFHDENEVIDDKLVGFAGVAVDSCIDSIKAETLRILDSYAGKDPRHAKAEMQEMGVRQKSLLKVLLPDEVIRRLIAGNREMAQFLGLDA